MHLWTALAALPLVASVPSSVQQHPWLLPREAASVDKHITARAADKAYWQQQAKNQGRKICYVLPTGNGEDDAPAIMNALNKECRTKSLVVFPGPTYTIKTNMTTDKLDDVQIEHYGHFQWSTDIDYWLSVSMPIGFQNQSTVWYFGGNNIHWDGHGIGTLDGNGQVWYDWAKNQGNLPHRPMMINWRHMSNSVVQGMRFVQSQMWTMAVTYSKHLQFTDIYVNNTSTSQWNTLNTDGVDTVYSDDITFLRWKVTSGDDGIALKGNSSNVKVLDSEFWGGQGLAIGSVGQYNGKYEYINNFFAKNLTMHNTAHAIYLKTWGGVSKGYPPNGGGGGLGVAENIVIEDIYLDGARQQPFFMWQCENYEGHLGEDCQSSKFKLKDATARNVHGYTQSGVQQAGWLQCSIAAGGCDDITLVDFNLTRGANGPPLTTYHCENVNGAHGFTCNA